MIAQGNDVEARDDFLLRVVLDKTEQARLMTPLIDANAFAWGNLGARLLAELGGAIKT